MVYISREVKELKYSSLSNTQQLFKTRSWRVAKLHSVTYIPREGEITGVFAHGISE